MFSFSQRLLYAALPILLAFVAVLLLECAGSKTIYRSDNNRDNQPVFSVENESVEGVLGTKVVLGCRVKYNRPYLKPLKVVWYKQKRTLTFNHRRVIDDSRFSVATSPIMEHVWDLQIDPVQLTDDGDYDCIINTEPPKKKKVKLIVKVPPRINFHVWNGERVLKEGMSHRVPCVASGKPHPNVTWYREKKDKPRETIGTFDFQSDIYMQGSTLVFDSVHRSMEGSYLCVASNGVFPDAKKWIIVIVQFPPQVRVVNTRIGQRRGELTIIQCKVWGNPVGKMSWEFNGTELPKVPPCHQHMEREKLCEEITKPFEDSRRISVDLTVRNISSKDYGTYTCVSTSVMGTGRGSTELHEVVEDRRYQQWRATMARDWALKRSRATEKARQLTTPAVLRAVDQNVIQSSWHDQTPKGNASPALLPTPSFLLLLFLLLLKFLASSPSL